MARIFVIGTSGKLRLGFAVVSVVLSCGLCILYLCVWVCLMFFLLANKKRLVLHDVVQHLHWLLTRELLHQIVRSGKDSIATILGNGRYMLPDVGGVSHLLPDFTKGSDLDRNVGNFSSEDMRENVSHFVLR